MSTFVIAEMSANHNHQKQIALDTIKAAKEAGADAVKIQSRQRLPSLRFNFVVTTTRQWREKESNFSLYAKQSLPKTDIS